MTRYELAKLVQWAGKLRSRKRLQKVVFLLKASGCPFDVDYTLHHYGPYSPEVARLSDEMAQLGLLEEFTEENQVGIQYSYTLAPPTQKELAQLEKTDKGKKLAKSLASFEELAKELLQADLRLLEVASTMVYFRQHQQSWAISVERTCKFKNLTAKTDFVTKAEELARRVVA